VKTTEQVGTVVNAPTTKPHWSDGLIAPTKLKPASKTNLATALTFTTFYNCALLKMTRLAPKLKVT